MKARRGRPGAVPEKRTRSVRSSRAGARATTAREKSPHAGEDPRAGHDSAARGDEGERGRGDTEERADAQGRHPRAGEDGHRHPSEERAERLEHVEPRDALAGLPQPGGRGGERGERPPHRGPRGRQGGEREDHDESEAGQLSRRRRQREPQQTPAQDAERGEQHQEGEAGRGVSRSPGRATAPRGRGAGGDPAEPGREPHADRGLVARHVHDELAQQQHLRGGGEETGREEGRVAHRAQSTPGVSRPAHPARAHPGPQFRRLWRNP